MKKIIIFLLLGFFIVVNINAFDIGDRVLVNWSVDEYWYPGTIIDINSNEYHISFDDFDREWVEIGRISKEELKAGDVVECLWEGGTTYYPGTIRERMRNAVYIYYDDGDKEKTTINHIRVLEP